VASALGPSGTESAGRRPWAFRLIVAALAAIVLLGSIAWWAYPRLFPVETVNMRPGDTYAARSGVTITVPGQKAVHAFRERRPEASGQAGISDSLDLTGSMPGFPSGVTIYSYWDAARNLAFRGVMKTYSLVGPGNGGATEVRWHDFGADGAALAVVTRLPGHDTGVVLAFNVPGVGSSQEAHAAAHRLWSQLSAQGASVP
jgi:hypothetical protein